MINAPLADFRLFWTAYDPLDLASGSIDVLGLQGAYMALADKLLPGFSTVTTTPRYVSMLCAAVAGAEAAFPAQGEPAVRIRQARLEAVKSFERAWAVACGFAMADSTVGDAAVDGLRGIQYVRRKLSELSGAARSIRTRSVTLLANQVRYGGIGAYSSMLEDCHLASMRSVSLRPLGAAIAESFPRPADELNVWDEDQPLSIDGLTEWGRKCHLGRFSRDEGRRLATALRGGEEGDWQDDVRWTTLRMLASFEETDLKEAQLLQQMLDAVRRGDFDRMNAPLECIRQIEATLVLIRAYERLSQGIQFLFDAVRGGATDEPEISLETLAGASHCVSACAGARTSAKNLLAALEEAGNIHTQTGLDIRATLVEFGLVNVAEAICDTSEDSDLIGLVLNRHRDIQQGKLDRGERKATWLRQETAGGLVRLTAQRHELPRSKRYDSWDDLPWHPYRTDGARRFVRGCGIR